MDKLAVFLSSLAGGGAERAILNVARGLSEQRLHVDLVLCQARGPYLNDVPRDVRVVDLKASRILTAVPGLSRYIKREQPAAILSTLSPVNCVALLACRLARSHVRLVLCEQNSLSQNVANSPYARARLMPRLMRWTYPWANGVVGASLGVADDLSSEIGYPRNSISVIYNPIETAKVQQLANEPITDMWFHEMDGPIILGVGRLIPQKDFPTLMRSIALVRQQRPVRLVILGEGPDRDSLISLATELGIIDYCELPGFVSNPYKYMKRASVFALSSRWEGFGNVVVEAMSCGTPVVCTDCPSGPSEILENGRWGRLVPVGDVDALALAIRATLDNPGVDPCARAEYFSVGRAADEYLSLLLPERKQSAL